MQKVESDILAAEVDSGEQHSEALRLRLRQLRWFLFSFRGRINRVHLLLGIFMVYGIPALAYFLVLSLSDSGLLTIARPFRGSSAGEIIELAAFCVGIFFFFWVNWAIGLKRFHDFDRSAGTMILVGLAGAIPVVGWLASLTPFIIPGNPGINKYGDGPGWVHASQ